MKQKQIPLDHNTYQVLLLFAERLEKERQFSLRFFKEIAVCLDNCSDIIKDLQNKVKRLEKSK